MQLEEKHYWIVFSIIGIFFAWYAWQIIHSPYWSREPVLHTHDFFFRCGICFNRQWNRGMTTHKYLDEKGVVSYSASNAKPEEFDTCVAKYLEFLRDEYLDVSSGSYRNEEIELTIPTAVLASGIGTKISAYVGRGFADISGGGAVEEAWLRSRDVRVWYGGGTSAWGGGVMGEWCRTSGVESTGKYVDYICGRRMDGKKHQQRQQMVAEIVRRLFTTHMYRVVFGPNDTKTGSGVPGFGIFRDDPTSVSMRGVVPFVRFWIYEIVLDERFTWPRSRRISADRVGGKWERVSEHWSVSKKRLWKKWVDGFMTGSSRLRFICMAMNLMELVRLDALHIWVNISKKRNEEEGQTRDRDTDGDEYEDEIVAVVIFKNDFIHCVGTNEIRGMADSGCDYFTVSGIWFAPNIGVREGYGLFVESVREMRGMRKTMKRLFIERMGFGCGLLDYFSMGAGGRIIGELTGRKEWAYYLYNYFLPGCDARDCMVIV